MDISLMKPLEWRVSRFQSWLSPWSGTFAAWFCRQVEVDPVEQLLTHPQLHAANIPNSWRSPDRLVGAQGRFAGDLVLTLSFSTLERSQWRFTVSKCPLEYLAEYPPQEDQQPTVWATVPGPLSIRTRAEMIGQIIRGIRLRKSFDENDLCRSFLQICVSFLWRSALAVFSAADTSRSMWGAAGKEFRIKKKRSRSAACLLLRMRLNKVRVM